jgi:hypothetical protein
MCVMLRDPRVAVEVTCLEDGRRGSPRQGAHGSIGREKLSPELPLANSDSDRGVDMTSRELL